MIRDITRLLGRIAGATAVLAGSIAVVAVCVVMWRAWNDTHNAVKTVMAPLESLSEKVRVLRGTKSHPDITDADFANPTPRLLAAIAIASDTAGEDEEGKRTEAMRQMFDAMLRREKRGMSLEANFRQAGTFFPPGWKHQAGMAWYARWTTGWIDRDPKQTARTVSMDTLKQALRIVDAGLAKGAPDPEHCAIVVNRVENRWPTWADGELKARKYNLANLTPDVTLKKYGLRIPFFCDKLPPGY